MLTVTEGRERTKDALSALCNQASLCLDKVITTHSSEFAITRWVVPIRHGPGWTWG